MFEVRKAKALEYIQNNCASELWCHVYTDSSVEDVTRNGGSGVYIKYPDTTSSSHSFAVGKLASTLRAELQAIREATNILIERNTTNSNKIILSDCRAALRSLQSEARDEVVEIIFRNIGQLQTNNTLALQWIPAHCGLFGYEKADRLAKDGSSKPQPPAKISFQETKTLLKNSTNKAWKNRINIKYLTDNIHYLPRNFQTTMFRLRTGVRQLNAHMHRLKIGSTPLCDCGYSPDSGTCTDELPTH